MGRKAQRAGDHLVGRAARQQVLHLQQTGRQRPRHLTVSGGLMQCPKQRIRHKEVPRQDGAKPLQHRPRLGRLGDEPTRPRRQRGAHQVVPDFGRDQNRVVDPGRVAQLMEEPVLRVIRQVDVQKDPVRRGQALQRLAGLRCAVHTRRPGVPLGGLQQCRQALAGQGVVIHDQDIHGAPPGCCPPLSSSAHRVRASTGSGTGLNRTR